MCCSGTTPPTPPPTQCTSPRLQKGAASHLNETVCCSPEGSRLNNRGAVAHLLLDGAGPLRRVCRDARKCVRDPDAALLGAVWICAISRAPNRASSQSADSRDMVQARSLWTTCSEQQCKVAVQRGRAVESMVSSSRPHRTSAASRPLLRPPSPAAASAPRRRSARRAGGSQA